MSGIENNIQINKKPNGYVNNETVQAGAIENQQVVINMTSSAPSTKVDKVDIDYPQKLLELAQKKGFKTVEDLFQSLAAKPGCENITSLSLKEQYTTAIQALGENETQPVSTEKSTDKVEKKTKKEEKTVSYKEFATLGRKEKVDVLLEELAKNEFLYGDKENLKTIKDWNALSDEQKQQVVADLKAKVLEKIKAENNGRFASAEDFEKYVCDIFGADAIDNNLMKGLTYLRAATFNQKNIQDFLKQDEIEKADDIQFELTQIYWKDNAENYLTKEQLAFCKQNEDLSRAIRYVSSNYADNSDVETAFSLSEIKQRLNDLKMNPLEVQIKYLEAKKAKGLKVDEAKLEDLKQRNETVSNLKNYEPKDSSVIDGFKQSDAYQKSNFEILSNNAKITVVKEYINKNFSNLKPDEYAQKVRDLMVSMSKDNPELLAQMSKMVYDNATPEQRTALASMKDIAQQAINAGNINNMSEEHSVMAALTTETMCAKAKTPEAQAELERVGLHRISISDEPHAIATSRIDAGSSSVKMQRAHSEKTDELSVEGQRIFVNDGAELYSDEVHMEAAVRTDKLHKEVQCEAVEKFSKRKCSNNAMIEDDTVSRLAVENQTAAMKTLKNRCEQDDYSKDEAVNYLNKLADQIHKCDKNNQLDMHNEMMTSKYSEVQEHTAGNIGNYDPSVQAGAMESVYASGNTKAIANAIESVCSSNSPVQGAVLETAGMKDVLIGGLSNDNKAVSELAEKIKNGQTLTSEEYNSLSAIEKYKYKMACFKSLPSGKQIKILSSITDNNMKKAIYRYIATTHKSVLKRLIEDNANTAEFIYDMHVADEMIEQIAEFKGPSDNGYAKLYRKIINSEQNDDSNIAQSTFFNRAYELFPKDKTGSVLT